MKIRFTILLGIAALLAGCQESRTSTPGFEKVFVAATPHDISDVEYIIGPQDEITVQSPNIKEMDKQKQIVRPDGKMSLNLLGEVAVATKTPRQVNEMLQQMASKYYVNPDIKIEVIANSKFFFVVGAGLNNQGKRPYTGNDSMIKAIAEAGFNDGAWPQQVLLSRPKKPGLDKTYTVVVDFKRIFEHGELWQNYRLEEGDIIDVRDSPLTKLNKDLDKVIGPFTGAGAVVSSSNTVASPAAHP